MHVKGFLHKLLSSVIHKKRLTTLIILVTGLIQWKRLSITELGRGINLNIQERSAIRRADRFVGNRKLRRERAAIFRQHAGILVGSRRRPKIIVDWTHIPNTKLHALRAALVAKGRALTLYEEVHLEKNLSNAKVEKKFLDTLNSFLPANCKPIIITDAGFRNPWFKKIFALEWDFVGRVRGTHKYYDGKRWFACRDLLLKATKAGKYVGEVILCKKNSITTSLYLIKEKNKKRLQRIQDKKEKMSGTDKSEYRRSATEGWLLASSIKGKNSAAKVIKIYKMRMQIEEAFRDLKSSQYGFGFEKAHSKDRKRVEVLLLIAMFASLIAWLTGYVVEQMKLNYQFQVNSTKRRTLSLFNLGCRAIIKRNVKISTDDLESACIELWRGI